MIKTITKIGIAVALIVIMYQEALILNQTAEIKEAVVETNEIVKEIRLHNTPYDLENDYHCLASNIYWEARNQPLLGQLAVAQVTQNRVDSKRFPDTICDVVMEGPTYSWKPDFPVRHKCQFSWYCDGKSDTPLEFEAWNMSVMVAENILANVPPKLLEGAIYYHATNVDPFWAKEKTFIKQIGDHLFYKE